MIQGFVLKIFSFIVSAFQNYQAPKELKARILILTY